MNEDEISIQNMSLIRSINNINYIKNNPNYKSSESIFIPKDLKLSRWKHQDLYLYLSQSRQNLDNIKTRKNLYQK